jgi:hypothetical protein
MYLDGQWHTIALGGVPASLLPDERLDVSRLQTLILAPLLGIGDVRTDARIDFVGGAGAPRSWSAAWTRANGPWPSRCFPSVCAS